MRKRRGAPAAKTLPIETASIERLSHDLRGIAQRHGKIVFIDNALPGEILKFQTTSTRSKFDEGVAIEILQASADRCEPPCPHAIECGGCSLQHMQPAVQIIEKQKILLDQLARFGNITVPEILPPLTAEAFFYRRKARIGVRLFKGKDKGKGKGKGKDSLVIGFREKRSNNLAPINECHILHRIIAEQIPRLKKLLGECDGRAHISQLEVAIGEDAAAIVLRHLQPLSDADQLRWVNFSKETGIHLYLQPGDAESAHKLWPQDGVERLQYALPDFDLQLRFHPLDFIQVNFSINRQMVARAVELLDAQPDERVLDLFCGLGNFTLPLARRALEVVGIEGEQALIQRGIENASHNGVQNVQFFAADLTQKITAHAWAKKGFDKILIDPPRTGALEVIRELARFKAKKIVYISCNPATLARDAGELAKLGYRLSKAGVMDMFPQTTHVESMAVFERIK